MHTQLRLLVMSSGERLPVLFDSSGQPLASPLLFALTELRARGRATATIRQSMQAVQVLLKTLARHDLDLEVRLARGHFLQLHEIDLIVREAAQRIRAVDAPLTDSIGPSSTGTRLHYMLAYLRWRGLCQLLRLDARDAKYLELKDRIDKACSALRARAPSLCMRSDLDQRQGLSAEEFTCIEAASKGQAQVLHWRNAHAQQRNRLILRWLIHLGIRRGELLGVRIRDIDFQQNLVLIARRADDRTDPRSAQPLTKTRARQLDLSDELAQVTYDYVMGTRSAQGHAARHDFLFVAGGTGRPLSLAGLNKVFADLRRSDPTIPASLTPHVLRHTWNDRFSSLMEQNKVSPEMEKRIRSTLMGWSMTSDTAATYTRRHVRQAAAQAISKMQEGLRPAGGAR